MHSLLPDLEYANMHQQAIPLVDGMAPNGILCMNQTFQWFVDSHIDWLTYVSAFCGDVDYFDAHHLNVVCD
jgi:hypothetical protein